jgi:hypothetical protein
VPRAADDTAASWQRADSGIREKLEKRHFANSRVMS